MLKPELKKCKKCGKPFLARSGGIVIPGEPRPEASYCDECRKKMEK